MLNISHSQYAGPSSLLIQIEDVDIWFSYQTVVAVQTPAGLLVSENCWSTTTGKHLKAIDPDRSKRLPRAEFEAQAELAVGRSIARTILERKYANGVPEWGIAPAGA
jgi:hypothetical protein